MFYQTISQSTSCKCIFFGKTRKSTILDRSHISPNKIFNSSTIWLKKYCEKLKQKYCIILVTMCSALKYRYHLCSFIDHLQVSHMFAFTFTYCLRHTAQVVLCCTRFTATNCINKYVCYTKTRLLSK